MYHSHALKSRRFYCILRTFSPKALLSGLAVSDTLSCLAILAINGLPTFGNEAFFELGYILSPVTIPVAFISWTGSIYMTLLLSYELYLAVCHEKRLFLRTYSWQLAL